MSDLLTDDLKCQWCKRVVAVNVGLAMWLAVVENVGTPDGKHYCTTPCYENLAKMRKYVRDHFK